MGWNGASLLVNWGPSYWGAGGLPCCRTCELRNALPPPALPACAGDYTTWPVRNAPHLHVLRAIELAGDYTIWQDFPDEPGQVYSYIGKCERYVFTSPQIRFFVDEEMQKRWVLGGTCGKRWALGGTCGKRSYDSLAATAAVRESMEAALLLLLSVRVADLRCTLSHLPDVWGAISCRSCELGTTPLH